MTAVSWASERRSTCRPARELFGAVRDHARLGRAKSASSSSRTAGATKTSASTYVSVVLDRERHRNEIAEPAAPLQRVIATRRAFIACRSTSSAASASRATIQRRVLRIR